MLNDPLANALSTILGGEKVGKKEVIITPVSNLTKTALTILQNNSYIKSTEIIENSKGGVARITLSGNINKCGVIKPRYSITKQGYEKFEKRYLPAKDMGILLVSTSKGIITHIEAKTKNIGGRLIAYCY